MARTGLNSLDHFAPLCATQWISLQASPTSLSLDIERSYKRFSETWFKLPPRWQCLEVTSSDSNCLLVQQNVKDGKMQFAKMHSVSNNENEYQDQDENHIDAEEISVTTKPKKKQKTKNKTTTRKNSASKTSDQITEINENLMLIKNELKKLANNQQESEKKILQVNLFIC